MNKKFDRNNQIKNNRIKNTHVESNYIDFDIKTKKEKKSWYSIFRSFFSKRKKNDSKTIFDSRRTFYYKESYNEYREKKRKRIDFNKKFLLFQEEERYKINKKKFSFMTILNCFLRIFFIVLIIEENRKLSIDYETDIRNKYIEMYKKNIFTFINLNIFYINFINQKNGIISHFILSTFDHFANYIFYVFATNNFINPPSNNTFEFKNDNVSISFFFKSCNKLIKLHNNVSKLIIEKLFPQNMFKEGLIDLENTQEMANIMLRRKISSNFRFDNIENSSKITLLSKSKVNILTYLNLFQVFYLSIRSSEIIIFCLPFIYLFENFNNIMHNLNITEYISNILKFAIKHNIIYIIILYLIFLRFKKNFLTSGKTLFFFFLILLDSNMIDIDMSNDMKTDWKSNLKIFSFLSITIFMLFIPYIGDFTYDFKLFSWFEIYVHSFIVFSINIIPRNPTSVINYSSEGKKNIFLFFEIFSLFYFSYVVLSDNLNILPSRFIFNSIMRTLLQTIIIGINTVFIIFFKINYNKNKDNNDSMINHNRDNEIIEKHILHFNNYFTYLNWIVGANLLCLFSMLC